MGDELSSYASTPGPSFDLEDDSSVLSTVLESTQLDAAMTIDVESQEDEGMPSDVENRST